jgi:hypothetical protein
VLPYHTYSFIGAIGARVIKSINGTDQAVFDWMTNIFNNQDQFYNDTASIAYMQTLYANLAASTTNIPYATFLNGLNDPNMDEAARIGFKFAAQRSITGTPAFHLQGLPVNDQVDGTFNTWVQLIDSVLASGTPNSKTRLSVKRKTC